MEQFKFERVLEVSIRFCKVELAAIQLALIKFQYVFIMYDIGCKLLSHMLLKGNRLPTLRHIARHYVTYLEGLDYDHIHACVNDCILFHGMRKEAQHCPTCGEARYKTNVKSFDVPRKVLRHFSIIPCIKYMFKCKSISKLMLWHSSH